MKHKIVFFDVDGTITNYKDGTIAKSTKASIRKLLDKGIRVVAATGRPLSMCDEIAKLGINTFITANGAYVKHDDIVIHKIVLNHEIVREVMKYASTEKNALTFYSEKLQMNNIKHPMILKALNETLSLEEYPPENLAEAYAFSNTLSFALSLLLFSSSSSGPGRIGLRVITFPFDTAPHTHTGKSGGHVHGFSAFLNASFTILSSRL